MSLVSMSGSMRLSRQACRIWRVPYVRRMLLYTGLRSPLFDILVPLPRRPLAIYAHRITPPIPQPLQQQQSRILVNLGRMSNSSTSPCIKAGSNGSPNSSICTLQMPLLYAVAFNLSLHLMSLRIISFVFFFVSCLF